jgi:hypothetical protein
VCRPVQSGWLTAVLAVTSVAGTTEQATQK